jgi:response regulator of citrate/malate metabolism
MKRDPLEIMQAILRVLEERHEAMTMNQIAQTTGIHNITVRRYVQMIEMVRQEPTIEVIKTNHSVIVRVIKQGGAVVREEVSYG